MSEPVSVGGERVVLGPCLRVLGAIDLVGATGSIPTRSRSQTLEMLAWLLCHPNAASDELTSGLALAASTRRATLCRLRGWLGTDESGKPFLPKAYSSRIRLHPDVTSDWLQVRLLIGEDVAAVPVSVLIEALRLVRGPVLWGVRPGRWQWADGLRAEIAWMLAQIGEQLRAQVGGCAHTGGQLRVGPISVSRSTSVPRTTGNCELKSGSGSMSVPGWAPTLGVWDDEKWSRQS